VVRQVSLNIFQYATALIFAGVGALAAPADIALFVQSHLQLKGGSVAVGTQSDSVCSPSAESSANLSTVLQKSVEN
jgi:hypothetical protein